MAFASAELVEAQPRKAMGLSNGINTGPQHFLFNASLVGADLSVRPPSPHKAEDSGR